MFRYFVALIDRTSEIYNFEKKITWTDGKLGRGIRKR